MTKRVFACCAILGLTQVGCSSSSTSGSVDGGPSADGLKPDGLTEAGSGADSSRVDGNACEVGSLRCEGDELVTCAAGGKERREACRYGCDAALAPPACVPCPPRMVLVSKGGHCIDRYEASEDPAQSGRARSVAGELPWVSITSADAALACAAAGKRLCSRGEWEAACKGPSGYSFPYGGSYKGTACNTYDKKKLKAVPTGSIPTCEGGYAGIFDMSGNVWEWVACDADAKECKAMGGAYSQAVRTTCTSSDTLPPAAAPKSHGFRCCLTPGEEPPPPDGGPADAAPADAGPADSAPADLMAPDTGPASCGSAYPHGSEQQRDCYAAPTEPCSVEVQTRSCSDGKWSDWPACDWFACGSGAFLWGKRLSSLNTNTAFGATIDGAGNATVAAAHGASSKPTNFTLASFAPDGSLRWKKGLGGKSSDYALGIASDAAGNVYATGYARSTTADFGGGDRPGSTSDPDLVVVSYDSAGNHRWSLRFDAAGDQRGHGVVSDAAGTIHVVGTFDGTLDLGGATALVSAGDSDIFVASFDDQGQLKWAERYGGSGEDRGLALARDGAGAIYVTGTVASDVDFGGGSRPAAVATQTMFLASFSEAGAHRWSKTFDSGSASGNGVAADSQWVYLTGGIAGDNVDLGQGALADSGGAGFLARYATADGAHGWSKHWEAYGLRGNAVALDPTGTQVFVVGEGKAGPGVDFGGGPLRQMFDDMFVVSYAASGAYRWHEHIGIYNTDELGTGVAASASQVVVTGRVPSVLFVDGQSLGGLKNDGLVLGLVP